MEGQYETGMKALPPNKATMVLIAAVMAVASLALSLLTWSRLTESFSRLERVREEQRLWLQLFSQHKDAETGQRGYVITGDDAYLRPYEAAMEAIPKTFTDLSVFYRNNPRLAGILDEVQKLSTQRLLALKKVVVVREREGIEAGRQLILSGEGKMLMDQLRDKIHEISGMLEERLGERAGQMKTDMKWGYVSSIGTGVTALGAGLVSLMLFRDTLQQLRRETRLSAAKQKAEDSSREKSVFLATMGHEIRTPMNAILGFGELLDGEVKTEQEKRYVQAILAGGRSLLRIINDILDISKIEAGMMALNLEPTSLEELAGFIKQIFTPQASRKGIEFVIETAPDMPKSLLVDSVRLRQILFNVVGNAVKFTDRGRITLRMGGGQHEEERSRWRLIVEVEDTGAGIPPERQEDVFKPFVQAWETSGSPTDHGGTGLGLAIVKRLTELMKGSVSLHSEVGKGSTFRFEFPEIEISARLPAAETRDEAPVDFNELRPSSLVIVDDNETNRQLIEDIFAKTQHRLRFASNGQEAIDLIVAEPPDVALMDLRMPVMDGRTALALLREKPGLELLPVIAVTASSMAGEEAALRRSFDGYVRKPFSRFELFQELSQFIPRVEADRPDTAPLDASGSAPPDPAQAERWRGLAAHLRELERNVWPSVRQGMAMLEIARFAAEVRALADAAGCAAAAGYAQRLQAEAEAFSISDLEKSLAEFPSLIHEIETRATPGTPPA